jgi:hypothetical protein
VAGASDRFALEPDLPLVAGAQFHKPPSREASIFHGAIADTEPDGWARRVILRDHARRRALTRAAGEAHTAARRLLEDEKQRNRGERRDQQQLVIVDIGDDLRHLLSQL